MAINVEEILQTKIEKSKHHLKEELTTVRAGKANAALCRTGCRFRAGTPSGCTARIP